MNRLQQLFQHKKKDLLSIYYTAGYPHLNDTLKIAQALEQNGADFLEIGFPYSDPVADGPIIQQSSKVALDNGMNLALLFEQLTNLRKEVSIPVLLMGYVNVVLQFGIENFCKKCLEVGIDGCIIPDLPMYEYEELYQPVFKKYGISNIFLVTPQTTEERIRKIDELSDAFIYLVSSSSTTGSNLELSNSATRYFQYISALKLKNLQIIGFGISDKKTYDVANTYTSGAIIGSAFVKNIDADDIEKNVKTFMQKIRT